MSFTMALGAVVLVLNFQRGNGPPEVKEAKNTLDYRYADGRVARASGNPAVHEPVEDLFDRILKRPPPPIRAFVLKLHRFRNLRLHFPAKHYSIDARTTNCPTRCADQDSPADLFFCRKPAADHSDGR